MLPVLTLTGALSFAPFPFVGLLLPAAGCTQLDRLQVSLRVLHGETKLLGHLLSLRTPGGRGLGQKKGSNYTQASCRSFSPSPPPLPPHQVIPPQQVAPHLEASLPHLRPVPDHFVDAIVSVAIRWAVIRMFVALKVADLQTQPHMHTDTYMHTYTRTYIQTHTPTYRHLYTHTRAPTYKHTHTYIQTHRHTDTYIQTHAHTYIQTHTHTYIQTHTYRHTY